MNNTGLINYIDQISSLVESSNGKPIWFRGVKNDFDITPGAYRQNNDEGSALIEFYVRSYTIESEEDRIVRGSLSYEQKWRRYFQAQHYGLATRLVDWTENPLVALYFAIKDFDESEEYIPCVWTLQPHLLNTFSIKDQSIVVPAGEISSYWLPSEDGSTGCLRDNPVEFNFRNKNYDNRRPIALWAPRTNARLVAQQGVFTVHGTDELPINKIKRLNVSKIDIDPKQVENLKKLITVFGMRESSLFPELDKLANEIRNEYYQGSVVSSLNNKTTVKKVGKKKASIMGTKMLFTPNNSVKKTSKKKGKVSYKKLLRRLK